MQAAIAQIRTFQNLIIAAVKPAIADQDELASQLMLGVGSRNSGALFGQGLQSRHQVGQLADAFLERPGDDFDGARVQAGTRQLRKVAALRPAVGRELRIRQVHARFATALDGFPCGLKLQRYFHLTREHVHRAQGQESQTRALETIRRVADPIEHLVERPVAAGGNNEFKSLGNRFGGKSPRLARRGGLLESAIPGQRAKPGTKQPGFLTLGSGIKNDAHAHARKIGGGARRVETKPAASCICLRFVALFVNLYLMREVNAVSVPKWPFFLGDVVLLGAAYLIYSQSHVPLVPWELWALIVCAALGATLGVWPFVLDHRAVLKQLDSAALGSTAEKLQNLEQIAKQISAASNEWQNAHLQAERASGAAREITERITTEARAFMDFLQKANDSERATLRLEVEKLRRAEADWLQVLVRVLDHVHALHAGAVRSGQVKLIEQLQQFQNACHDAVRRVGLVPFGAAPGEPFNAERHKTPNGEPPAAEAVVAETMAAGFTYQSRIIRHALVRPGDANVKPVEDTEPAPSPAPPESDELKLESPAAD